MKVHFIAIGGSAMHNLAIAMYKKGFEVAGSDDEIVEPSKTRLAKYNLLPAKEGWYPENMNKSIDAVILGMHARADNPELLKAKELGLKIYSYPEYIYEQTKDKTRVVIGGSHGKTTITAMILHVLTYNKIDCDYMVGAQLEGFETMVKLSKETKIAVIEGDEYLSSPIDRRPKFHLYKPNVAIISGIAWDHINVFPTFENYVEQFKIFIGLIEQGGSLIYCEEDKVLKKICEEIPLNPALQRGNVSPDDYRDETGGLKKFPYSVPKHKIVNGVTYIIVDKNKEVSLSVFGEHNLMNIEAARIACNQLRISDENFYNAISSFKGAAKRLELIAKNDLTAIYKDFAHSPSKLKATTAAMKKQFPDRKLVACMELHTFSSLNEKFLLEYDGAMANADEAIVYFNPHTIEHKKLKPISSEQVKSAFGGNNLDVYTDSKKIVEDLMKMNWKNKNLLMMSSGNFDGIDFKKIADDLIGKG